MTKKIDISYLDLDSPADAGVRLYVGEPDVVVVEIDIDNGGTMRLRLGTADCLKLATRMFAVAKLAKGELPVERGPAS